MSTRDGTRRWIPRSTVGLRVAYHDDRARVTGASLDSRDLQVQPLRWSVTLNDHRTPDEFSVSFVFKDVPFTPTIVKAASVRIYLGTVENMGDELPGSPDNLLIIGKMDSIDEEWSDIGQVVTMTGRDETALFLDPPWPRGLEMAVGGMGIDTAVKQILGLRIPPGTPGAPAGELAFTAVKSVKVYWDPNGDTVGKAAVRAADITPGIQPPTIRKKARRDLVEVYEEAKLWGVIYNLARVAGVICEIKVVDAESAIVLRPPSTLRPDSRTQTRSSEKVFLYGRNLLHLKVHREMGPQIVPNVAVTCEIDGELEVAIHPDPLQPTEWGSDGKVTAKTVLQFPVSGMASREALGAMAKRIYADISRKEATFTFATEDMESFDGQDLTRIRAGCSVRLQIDPDDPIYFGNISREQRAARLRAMGYAPIVASEIAANWDLVTSAPHVYFLDKATIDWDHEEGFSLAGDAVNLLGEA